jgi:hypothetical protein
VGLPDAWLAAGCLAQTVWNRRFGLPPAHGVSDLDIVYFDATDLGPEAEARHEARLRDAFAHLPVRLDAKNEARVHLWYPARFGHAIAPYRSTRDAIATFPTTATAVGIRPAPGGPEIEAPFGLADLLSGTVRANRRQIRREVYEAKVAKWTARWPELTIVPWDAAAAGTPGASSEIPQDGRSVPMCPGRTTAARIRLPAG